MAFASGAALAGLILALSLFADGRLADGTAPKMAESTTTQQFDFAGGGTVRLVDSYGDLYIEGWDRPQIEITVTRSTHYLEPNTPEARTTGKLDTVQVTAGHTDKEVTITTAAPKARLLHPFQARGKGVSAEYEIHLPRSTRLVIDHRGGSVSIGNVTADIDASDRDGDIMYFAPDTGSYEIDARSRMGVVSSDFAGKGHSRFLVGRRLAAGGSSASSKVRLRVGFGGITIVALPPEGAALATAGNEK